MFVCVPVSIAVNVDMSRNRGDVGARRDTELAADAGPIVVDEAMRTTCPTPEPPETECTPTIAYSG
jgi:hypothetical protein